MPDTAIGSLDGLSLTPEAATPGPGADFWYDGFAGDSMRIRPMTPARALTIATVFCCIKILAETVASLPWLVYQRLPNGRRESPTHRLYPILHSRPNRWQTSFEFREMMQGHLALRGNGYAEIMSGRRGFVSELIPLHPDRVEVKVLDNGSIVYDVQAADMSGTYRVPAGRMFHLRYFSLDGVVGLSPVEVVRRSLEEGAEQERAGLDRQRNDDRPTGILKGDQNLKPEVRDQLRSEWERVHSGKKRIAVLGHGLSWQQVGLSSEDLQFIEQRRFSKAEIAAIWRIPLHFLNELDRATHSNVEHMSIDFVRFTMLPWFGRWEQSAQRDLFEDDEPYFNEFDFNELTRADRKTRAESNQAEFIYGALNIDEWRKREGLNPLPNGAGQRHFIAANLIPLDRAGDNLNPQGGGAPVQEGPPDAGEEAAAVSHATTLAPLIRDAADRIQSTRLSLVRARLKKGASDRQRFGRWLSETLEPKLREYTERVIGPLLAVAGRKHPDMAKLLTEGFVGRLARSVAIETEIEAVEAEKAAEILAAIECGLESEDYRVMRL